MKPLPQIPEAVPVREPHQKQWARLLLVLVAFLLLRLAFWFGAFPNPDEAYYWLWGQHPALSYYDHPPLQAWVEGLFTTLLGRSKFALRLPNLLANAVFFYTYYRIVGYLYGEKAKSYFGVILLSVLATPLYFLFLALAWPDHLLITLTLVSAHLLITFLDAYKQQQQGLEWRLYGAAAALGLAGLTKYNAILVGLGFLTAILADRDLRPLLRSRHFYIAVAIVASACLPIFLWNYANDFQSFHYYFTRVSDGNKFQFRVSQTLGFLLFSMLMLSPIHSFGLFTGLRHSLSSNPSDSVYPAVTFWVLIVSTGILTLVSLVSTALYYWNITAYLLLFPLLPTIFFNRAGIFIGRRLFWSGQAYGLLFAVLLVIHYVLLPFSTLASQTADPDSRMLFGWPEVAAVVNEAARELGENSFLLTTDYRSASALAYQLNEKNVTVISERLDQFDFWYSGDQALRGRNSVILADDWHPADRKVLALFQTTSLPLRVPVKRFGVWIKNYYVIKGYHFQKGQV
ncbi:glycosyltransferase family 39 protein [Leptolyngbya sp. FACHB-261]|uniref:ArnT family glycosyltransferase n=1 Tax=Leptolyngbya sp. FACHB-261 TaxID=2692806 RepID=UPI001687076F|nr:glycosyltransferase family 39 protein [Leptolyngbya sp. FACHB-261]MBD2104009.1 glycosyltransferase family 39 protein [Leptolyngbya sp. FACHB-261]